MLSSMKLKVPVVLDTDIENLLESIQDSEIDSTNHPLFKKVLNAVIAEKSNVPTDVVMMHSTVKMHGVNGSEQCNYTIVFPSEVDSDKNRVSIFTPIGTSLLGCQKGDIIDLKLPEGIRKFKIEEVQNLYRRF